MILAIFAIMSIVGYILENYWQYLIMIMFFLGAFVIGRHIYYNFLIVDVNNKKPPVYYESSKNEENIKKGDDFEKFVVNLFPENKFTIVEWTTDSMRKHNRYVEADTRPDLLIRHNLSGDEFYIECKYRSYAFENKITWTNKEQLKRYQDFDREREAPVFVLIGLGGSPEKPDNLYWIPLEDAKYTELYISYMKKFQKSREYFN
ncbi:hypothetical protein [Methanolobus sp. ZRKC5]|uniref:hypothetical protein n=1 Tax=unclassified Methanolobus TaxID=2629569 RepID=UPI00313B1252